MPTWARLVTAIAALRVGTALTLQWSDTAPQVTAAPIPLWVYSGLAAIFGALGAMLVVTNRRDPRAAWLGGVFLLLAAPLSPPAWNTLPTSVWLTHVRPETFVPVFLWRFVAEFPSPVRGRWRVFVLWTTVLAGAVGLALALANLTYVAWPPTDGAREWRASMAAGPGHARSWYWLAVIAIGGSAFPFLLWRAQSIDLADRRRVGMFVFAFIGGVLPLLIQVLLEQLFEGYRRVAHAPGVEPWVGLVIFSALACVPFVTAYSVLFNRVVEVRVVLRAAAQHGLARYSIIGLTIVPFLALGLLILRHRDEPVMSLLSGPRPFLLGAAAALGAVALRLRQRWLDDLDRRFFREAYDARQVLTRFVDGLNVSSAGELTAILRDTVERALHTEVAIFVADDSSPVLRHVEGRHQPVAITSTLVTLATADSRPMDVDLDDRASPLQRLSSQERSWLATGGFRLLVPLRSSTGATAGLLTLSSKRSGLGYSDDDRRLLSTVASAAALALDNLRLRSTPEPASEPPAQECLECSRLSPPGTTQCVCGGRVMTAAVPQTLRGVFRLDRRIGAGGMGVVYKGIDLGLGRDVAIKTLPSVTPHRVARLRREARAMAALTHANLAAIHSVETWRGVPFLVEEFVGGGTLRDRLAAGRPAVREVLDWSRTLAGVLEDLHGAGIVHCDIKPSNIGFTSSGVVKLLDFGLARLLHELQAGPDDSTTRANPQVSGAHHRQLGARGRGHHALHVARGRARRTAVTVLRSMGLAVVLFEALAGVRPFEGRDVSEIVAQITSGRVPSIGEYRPDFSEELDAFLRAALAADRRLRPATAAAFGLAIQNLQSVQSLE